MRRRDEDLFRREPPWSWRREVKAAMRRIGIAVVAMLIMIAAFWLVFEVFGGISPG